MKNEKTIMKNKYIYLIFFVLIFISTFLWQQMKSPNSIVSEEEQMRYLSNGRGIYGFIDNDMFDYSAINIRISQGDAKKVKEEYENLIILKEDLERYAAIQNIIGIAEVYKGQYHQALDRFKETIAFIESKELENTEKILAVLYNNAGAVNHYFSYTLDKDVYLKKAEELCQEPYLSLIIRANQSISMGERESIKQQGIMIRQMEKVIKEAKRMEESYGLVQYMVARFREVSYMARGREEEAIQKLNGYICEIPDIPEYNMIRAELLGQLGYGYSLTGEYDKAIQALQQSIATAQKTVDENSQELAREYVRLANIYGKKEEWEKAREYLKKAIPGYKEMLLRERGMLYLNLGYCSWEMEDYEESKKNYFKSYICYCLYDQEIDPEGTNFEYSYPINDDLKKFYKAEEVEISYAEWMEKEMMEIGLEPDQWPID